MTREEAIKTFEEILQLSPKLDETGCSVTEAMKVALSALRGPTREMVERMRGQWIGMTDDDGCTWLECSRCEHDLDSLEEPNHFCPYCGAPMTDEAVEMVMERSEELYENP